MIAGPDDEAPAATNSSSPYGAGELLPPLLPPLVSYYHYAQFNVFSTLTAEAVLREKRNKVGQ